MTNQIETTLKGAIGKCKKDGGYFYDPKGPYRWKVDKYGRVVNYDDGEMFELHQRDFETKWIYEPPQKSAFQEWLAEEVHVIDTIKATENRKEGWNAAIDKVIEICISIPGFPGGERFEKIDSLKEP